MPDIGSAVLGVISSSKQNSSARRAEQAAKSEAELAYQRSLPWDVQGQFGEAQFDEVEDLICLYQNLGSKNMTLLWQVQVDSVSS